MGMTPIEHERAKTKICPFNPSWNNCKGKDCMAWKVVNPRIEQENHSGGKEMMFKERARRNFQEVKKEGIGSTAILILEEQGVCCKLM
jgi:hypothetical protein